MVLDHERLDVYLVALDLLVFANEVAMSFEDARPAPEESGGG